MNNSLHNKIDIVKIVEKYSDTLMRVSFTYLKNTSDAEDIIQEVFLKLIDNPQSFENDIHEKAWLIRVTINACKNRLKTAWFRKTQSLNYDIAYDFTPKETEVVNAVLDLPVKYRSIVLLFYFEGYSLSEVSQILKLKESTVGSQLHRARNILKLKLKEGFDDE